MAEAIGLASGLLTLAVFAFQSSVALYSTVQSFQSHNKRVRDLVDELDALNSVLQPLTDVIKNTPHAHLSLLDRPLLRCGKACQDFEQELVKCLSRSDGDRTSFRDWAKLRYMGEDVDGFRRLLTSYKLTISIALTDATLQQSSATAENLEEYKDLIRDATDDLQTRLESIDSKLNSIVSSTIPKSAPDTAELKLIEEERLSTQKCLQICEQLSHRIDEMQLSARRDVSSPDTPDTRSLAQELTDQGLNVCRKDLMTTTKRLENHMKDLTYRLTAKLQATSASLDEVAEITRLQDQWDAARQCIEICSTAEEHLQKNITVIDNWAAGDAVQFMVSTNGKVLHGKNKGTGWRTRQVGGYLEDATIMQLSRDMTKGFSLDKEPILWSERDTSPPALDEKVRDASGTDFQERHGHGVRLVNEPVMDLAGDSRKSVRSGRHN